MTTEDFFNAYKAVVLNRLQATPDAPLAQQLFDLLNSQGPSALRRLAQQILNELPAVPLGHCTYKIGDQIFCLNGVTRAECEGIFKGTFQQGPCPIERQY
jgi:hypothetical protein